MPGIRTCLTKVVYSLVNRIIAYRDSRDRTAKWYPTCLGRNFLYEPMFEDADGSAFWAKFHAEKLINPLTVNFKRFVADILKGRRCSPGQWHEVNIDLPSALPYCITGVDVHRPDGKYTAELKATGHTLTLENLAADRYYYLPIHQAGLVALRSQQEMIVAMPIPLVQTKKHQNRMVMVIFIDNFGWDVLKYIDLPLDLPNIHQFFSSGTIFDNCFSASNWTLAGVGAIVSGKMLSNHGMFHHTRSDVFLGKDYKVLSEYFQEDGYLTFQACGNTRKSPGYNYVKGFDRTVYRNEMPLCETMDAFYDHVRAFPKRDHFVWLTLMDVHHTLAAVPDIANQLQAPLEAADYSKPIGKSPMLLGSNPKWRARYIEELKRVDFHLGQMFHFLKSRYDDDEMLVTIVADHGPGCLSDDPHSISHQKAHVAWMLRGPGVPQQNTSELVHVTDILPSLLFLNGYTIAGEIDGRLPSALGGNDPRPCIISEVKFAGRPYEATVKDELFEFYLKTHARVDDAGTVDMSAYETELFLKGNWNDDVSAAHPDVVRRYADYVIDLVTTAARREKSPAP